MHLCVFHRHPVFFNTLREGIAYMNPFSSCNVYMSFICCCSFFFAMAKEIKEEEAEKQRHKHVAKRRTEQTEK